MAAVCVRGACKQYGRGSKAHKVLDELDMTVEPGTIYGLLGASGCGKTTLLTCIVGRRRLGSGDVWVLGGRPGSRQSSVPGPKLGYMPQELSLMREFSIRDALQHFWWLYGLPSDQFEERFQFLSKLLELPHGDTKVKDLSGGQQRRTSLAVTLVHDPELLILDEPTVGLDPVLRQNIWNHLSTKAAEGKTIIVTTHYIEEARQANKLGLMRNGKLLDEGSPEELLRRYGCSSIEEVFLALSAKQDDKTLPIKTPAAIANGITSEDRNGIDRVEFHNVPETTEVQTGNNTVIIPGTKQPAELQPAILSSLAGKLLFKNRGHAKALLSKNLYRIVRNPGAILFIFLFPIVEICTFYWAVGGWPKGMKMGVVNEELSTYNFSSCQEMAAGLGEAYGGTPSFTDGGLSYCTLEGISCAFLDSFEDSIAKKVFFKDMKSGMKEAKAGRLLGLLYFSPNFSKSFEERLEKGTEISNETIEASELPVFMDMSLRQSALLVEQKLREKHKLFLNSLLRQCNISERVVSIPLNVKDPVFGEEHFAFALSMTPGVIITMIFFLAVGVTAMIIVVERLDGIWDRTLCAGASSQEILLSHIVVETGVILLQSIESFVFVFYIFGMPCHGSLFHVVLLLLLQGICGMCGGFLVSVSCSTITASNFVSMGSFYPILILSGLLWPVEGMPPFLQTIAIALPTTKAVIALRNIMEKGWGMFDNYVYQGYLISIVWIIVFCSASLVVIRLRK